MAEPAAPAARDWPPRFDVVDWCIVPYLRAKSPEDRLRMIGALGRSARRLVEVSERMLHPDDSDEQRAERVRRRLTGGA